MAQSSFVADLQNALGAANVMPLSELLNGVYRGRMPGPVDYRVLQALLRRHDRQLVVLSDSVEFRPVLDVGVTPTIGTADTPQVTEIQAEKREIITTKCVKLVRFVRPVATSSTLDALQQRSDTLKLIVDDGVLTLHQVIPTNHRGGLAHHKRMGQITSTILAGKTPPGRPNPSSHAAVLARARHKRCAKVSTWRRILQTVFPAKQ
jgi:hypothetical protein